MEGLLKRLQRHDIGRLALIFTGLLMLAACGCSQGPRVEDNGPDVAQIAAETETFVGKSVSMRGLPVFYTAVYVSGDGGLLSSPDKNGWLCMLVVNQRKVTQAILLCTRSEEPLTRIHTQKGGSTRIEGPVKSFVKTDLIAYMKEKQGVDLVTTRNGQPLWIEDQLPLKAAPPDETDASPRPSAGLDEVESPASSSPAPRSTAASSPAAAASASASPAGKAPSGSTTSGGKP